MARTIFSSDITRDLIDLLQRVNERDRMTQEEANLLLVGALTFNWQVLKSKNKRRSEKVLKGLFWQRVAGRMAEIT